MCAKFVNIIKSLFQATIRNFSFILLVFLLFSHHVWVTMNLVYSNVNLHVRSVATHVQHCAMLARNVLHHRVKSGYVIVQVSKTKTVDHGASNARHARTFESQLAISQICFFFLLVLQVLATLQSQSRPINVLFIITVQT